MDLRPITDDIFATSIQENSIQEPFPNLQDSQVRVLVFLDHRLLVSVFRQYGKMNVEQARCKLSSLFVMVALAVMCIVE